jgi:Zn-finger nucleic acid-binding protein
MCPIDNTNLVITDRQGVEIDYCPMCRGVWLDRGELDKIIERLTFQAPTTPGREPEDYQGPRYSPKVHDKHSSQAGYDQAYPRDKRKNSFLGDLFDF